MMKLTLVLIFSLVATLPGLVAIGRAQDQPAPQTSNSGGWRKFNPQTDQPTAEAPLPPPADAQDAQQGAPADQAPPPPPVSAQQAPPQQNYPPVPPRRGYQSPYQSPYQSAAPAPHYAPATITLPSGTWVTMRLNEPLSSDHNQTGDAFTGTLLEPLIANGVLLARRGATVTGIVTEAQKAGRVSGVSHLKVELSGIQLADGRQVQVKTKLIDRKGNTSYGRDAFAIGATTATGAAIGAGVNGGVGAGVGAAAGLVVSTIGVLFTRGRATFVGPETPLTFSTETPLTVDNSQQTFYYATQQDYNAGPRPLQPRPGYRAGYPPPPYGYYAPAPVYAYPYPYPYYWGPSVYFGFGGRRGYWRR